MPRPHNFIDKDLKFEDSMFHSNMNPKRFSHCIVIPFKSEENYSAIKECKIDNENWAFDEIFISEEDYIDLLAKSKYVKTLAKI